MNLPALASAPQPQLSRATRGTCAWLAVFLISCGGGSSSERTEHASTQHGDPAGSMRAPSLTDSNPDAGMDGSAGPRAARTSGALTRRESEVLEELSETTARVRGLSLISPVSAAIHDANEIRSFIEANIRREASKLEESREMYVALGMLSPTLDLEAQLLTVLGEQIVGYYDPDTHRLVVRDDVVRDLARTTEVDVGAGAVLAHELVHALQDQHYDLKALNDLERDTDAANAFHALVEGDATLAMIGYATQRAGVPFETIIQNVDALRQIATASSLSGSALGQAPAIIRVTLMSSYIDGLVFCAALHNRGGWLEVGRAHEHAPASSEQVLHPEKYIAGEAPRVISLPAFPAIEALGFAPIKEDTLGELEMRVYFEPQNGDSLGAAAGWGGDRLRVYRASGNRLAVVWRTAWDTDADAAEAEQAAKVVATNVPDAYVFRDGLFVTITRGIPRSQAQGAHRAMSRAR